MKAETVEISTSASNSTDNSLTRTDKAHPYTHEYSYRRLDPPPPAHAGYLDHRGRIAVRGRFFAV